MVRLLIKAQSATHPDTEKDKACYKTGDIVAVKPGGWKWGRKERLPLFFCVDLPDMSMYEAECLIDLLQDKAGNLKARRKFFCTQDYFSQCIVTDDAYVTTKSDFIMYALRERE